jgi:hypothetical protein
MSFKTATELGLTEPQYCGLVKTLVALEEGKLDHENENKPWLDRDLPKSFHMAHWGGSCGTVCCIGGTAEALMRDNLFNQGNAIPDELYNLFFPGHTKEAYRASTKQAAVALRHYLTTGKENWKMAMETPR